LVYFSFDGKSFMQTILHIGMPKTGTTTLQKTFSANVDLLAGSGICYPTQMSSSSINHRILAYYAMNPSSYPRHMRAFRDAEVSEKLIAEFNNKLTSQILAIEGASALVLSAETLFTRIRDHKKHQYSEYVAAFGDRLAISAYLRSPAKAYLSVCQQKLKASQKISSISPARYRQVIQSYQETFPFASINLVPFERQSLIGQDIVADFCQRFLSATRLDPLALLRADDSNVSLSAESMAMSMLYRRAFWPNHDDIHTPGSNKIVNMLRKADKKVGALRPSLRDEVRQEVEGLASKDLLWLRRKHGITFEDINYDDLQRLSIPLPVKRQPKLLSEVVEIDRSKILDIIDVLASARFFQKSSARVDWLKMVSSLTVSSI
jgi:hypothetical protein